MTAKALWFDKTSAGDGISAAMFQSAILFIWAEQPIDISLQKEYREERLTHSEGAMKSIKNLAVGTAAITLSACVSNPNTAVLTPLLGAAGGFAGSQFGQGKGRVIATGVGALLGAFTGNHIGQTFDAVSHNTNAINRNVRGIGEHYGHKRLLRLWPIQRR